jgi:hypothetical protein
VSAELVLHGVAGRKYSRRATQFNDRLNVTGLFDAAVSAPQNPVSRKQRPTVAETRRTVAKSAPVILFCRFLAPIRLSGEPSPPYLSVILVYIKKNSSRAIIIKITHIIDPTIKRDISAKGLAP